MTKENNVLDTSLIKFDVTEKQLTEIRDRCSKIDRTNKTELSAATKDLVFVRRKIETTGKAIRDNALAFQREVLAKEKEYKGIIEPLEIEFKKLIQDIEDEEIRNERLKNLPTKLDMLSKLETITSKPDKNLILDMDEKQFLEFYQTQSDQNNKNIQAKKDQEKRDEEIRNKAISDTQKKADKELQELKKQQQDQAEKLETERKEKELLEKRKKYQEWLLENKYKKDSEEFYVQQNVDKAILYKKISEFKK